MKCWWKKFEELIKCRSALVCWRNENHGLLWICRNSKPWCSSELLFQQVLYSWRLIFDIFSYMFYWLCFTQVHENSMFWPSLYRNIRTLLTVPFHGNTLPWVSLQPLLHAALFRLSLGWFWKQVLVEILDRLCFYSKQRVWTIFSPSGITINSYYICSYSF
jgi:hypothetical protein